MSTAQAAGCSGTSPVSTPSRITQNITTTQIIDFAGVNSGSSNFANGLILSLSLDAKTYQQYQDVSITIDEKNTLSKTNRVAAADKWPVRGLTLGPCSQGSPFGVAVYQGDHNSRSISALTPLVIFNPNALYHCPAFAWGEGSSYDFYASSDIAAIRYSCDPPCTESYDTQLYRELSLTHYWDGCYPSTIHSFEPGDYTIVAADEWGNMVILHFTVTEPSN
jgi:hypothetical protein